MFHLNFKHSKIKYLSNVVANDSLTLFPRFLRVPALRGQGQERRLRRRGGGRGPGHTQVRRQGQKRNLRQPGKG